MNALVPKELAAKLSVLPRRPCALGEAGHEPHKPVFAEILDRSGHGTGHFVRLPQSMVEMITREARGPEPVRAPDPAPEPDTSAETIAGTTDSSPDKPRRKSAPTKRTARKGGQSRRADGEA